MNIFLFKSIFTHFTQTISSSKFLFSLKLLLVLCFILQACSKNKAPFFEGQQSLFDGKTLNGWKTTTGNGKFSVDKKIGAIVGEYVPSKKNTFLYREIKNKNFILKLKVKIDKDLNSGVQILSYFSNKPRLIGYQLDIDSSERKFTGGIYEEGLRRWLTPLTQKEHEKAKNSFKVGQWNDIDIQVTDGTTINTWVNGVHCVSLKDHLKNKKMKNIIALQVHSIGKKTKNNKVYFKDIQLQTELKSNDLLKDPNLPEYNFVPNTLTEREKNQNWELMWNGKNMDSWLFHDGKRFIKKSRQWEIVTLKNGSHALAQKSGNGPKINLLKKNPYPYFEFSFAFFSKKKANSGVMYYYQPKFNQGYEYQILLFSSKEEKKKLKASHKIASIYDLFETGSYLTSHLPNKKEYPMKYYLRPRENWNYGKVVCRADGTIEHWINNFKVVSINRNSKKFKKAFDESKYQDTKEMLTFKKGYFLLQNKNDNVMYHSLKLRPLK